MRAFHWLAIVALLLAACGTDQDQDAEVAAPELDLEEGEETDEVQEDPPDLSEAAAHDDLADHPLAAEPYVFEPVRHSGAGEKTIEATAPEGVPSVVEITYDGSDASSPSINVNVEWGEVGGSGFSTDTPAFTSRRLVEGDRPLRHVAIDADGEWEMALLPLIEVPAIVPGQEYAGDRDDIVLVTPVSDEPRQARLTHERSFSFTLTAWGPDGPDEVLDDRGSLDEIIELPPGTQYVQVDTYEPWTLELLD